MRPTGSPEATSPAGPGTPGPAHRPTLVDVAELAGVSRATASRVLLGRGRFSEASKDAVERAAAQLGYVPNALASDLASKQAHPSVGLLLRDATNPAYGLLFGCLQDQARRHELMMVTMTVAGEPDDDVQLDSLRRLLGLRVRALVVATGSVPSEVLVPHARDVWTIRAGRPESERLINAVSYDERAHGVLLAEHVWRRGHRRIVVGCVTAEVSLPEFHRSSAMVSRLAELGAVVEVVEVGHLGADEAAVASLYRARTTGSTCVMSPTDLRLLAVMRRCHQQGIVVGEELSLTGCDGILPGSDVMGLTTVRLPVEELARVTMCHVASGISSGGTTEVVNVELLGELVPGITVGPPPTHPPKF